MMLIASFVMQPRGRITDRFPFRIIRASVTLIVFRSDEELAGHVLGKVMHQSLSVKPYRKTAFHDQIFVIGDRAKMLYGFPHIVFLSWICSDIYPSYLSGPLIRIQIVRGGRTMLSCLPNSLGGCPAFWIRSFSLLVSAAKYQVCPDGSLGSAKFISSQYIL